MGQNNVFDNFIVMDDVFRLADKSDDFANFLTGLRKLSFTYVYVFHTMHPTRSSWRKIITNKNFQYFCRLFADSFCCQYFIFLL